MKEFLVSLGALLFFGGYLYISTCISNHLSEKKNLKKSLSQESINEILSLCSYPRHDATFEVRNRSFGQPGHRILVSFQVPDVTTGEQTTVSAYLEFGRYFEQPEDVVNAIYQAIVFLETHEVQEFFRFNGSQFINPHPPKVKNGKTKSKT